MTLKILAALLGGAAALSLSSAAAQRRATADDEPVRCVSMGSIRSTQILDDRHVLFFSGGERVYLNRLDRECLGLARSGTFEYRVQSGARNPRLCSTDSISVVELRGVGLNCGLGMFQPLSAEQLARLIGQPLPGSDARPAPPADTGSRPR